MASDFVVSRRFDDPDAFSDAIRGADVEFVPLARRRYEADLMGAVLGDVRLQRSTMSPNRARGGVDPASVTLLFAMTPGLDVLVNGRRLGAAQLALLRPGSEFHGAARDGLSWAAVTLPTGAFETVTESWRWPGDTGRAPSILDIEGAGVDELRQAIVAIANLGATPSPPLAGGSIAGSLASAIVDLVGTVRLADDPRPSPQRLTRDAMRIVANAEDYLASRIAAPIYSHEISRALGISERRLFSAFAAACGTSPHAYLKMRRLLLVRRALRSGGGDAGLVKSVALAHGFWHFGNFARDYRFAFGESPSETLRTSHVDGRGDRQSFSRAEHWVRRLAQSY